MCRSIYLGFFGSYIIVMPRSQPRHECKICLAQLLKTKKSFCFALVILMYGSTNDNQAKIRLYSDSFSLQIFIQDTIKLQSLKFRKLLTMRKEVIFKISRATC